MTPARQPTVVFAFAEPRRASRQMFLLLPNLGEPANDCFLSCKPLASQPTFVFSLASCLRASQRLFSLLQAACEQANVCFLSCKPLASQPTGVFSLASCLRASQQVLHIIYILWHDICYGRLRYSLGEVDAWLRKNLQNSAWEEKPSLLAISCIVRRVVSR